MTNTHCVPGVPRSRCGPEAVTSQQFVVLCKLSEMTLLDMIFIFEFCIYPILGSETQVPSIMWGFHSLLGKEKEERYFFNVLLS